MTNAEAPRPLHYAVSSHLLWRKSSYSGGTGGSCVEVADTPEASAVRDTQNRDKATLLFPAAEWRAFLTAAKHDTL
ncbi:MAG: DUF397 domain-containing protein [Nocardiopsaceae bacterium]|nr:DUF397 domain-containing protein [Nocardiopsaceae bacterium]